MRKTHLALLAAIVLATGLLAGAQKHARSWEYARLQYSGQGPTPKWSWIEPGISAEGVSADELCRELTVKTVQKKTDAYEIVSWAGSRGWELITMESISLAYTTTAWFKRPR